MECECNVKKREGRRKSATTIVEGAERFENRHVMEGAKQSIAYPSSCTFPPHACYINQALLALAPAATPKYIILPIHQNIQSQTPSVEFKAQSSEVSGMEGSTVNRPYPYVYCTPRPPPSRLTHTNPPLVVLNSRDAENVTENACWNGRGR